MRVTDQLALVCVLLVAFAEANPITQRHNPDTFSVTQVSRPAVAHEFRGRFAVQKVRRKFGHDNAPSAPPSKQASQKSMKAKAKTGEKKDKAGKKKDKAPAGAGETTADSADGDQEYVCEVVVGGQKTKLNFDTGSSDLWVYSTLQPSAQTKDHAAYDPKKSKSAKELKGGSWQISYGDGSSASGLVYTDDVKAGDVTANGQAIELAKNVSDSFMSDHNNNGLLGLGFPKGTTDGAGNTISIDGNSAPQNTFFSTVRSKLPLPLFTADLKHQAAGSYDFGFIDKSKYTGDIKYFDADSSSAYWGVTSQRYGVVGQKSVDKKINTIIDTGTTLLLMPQYVLDAYYKNVKNSRNDQNLGGYVFPCSEKIPDFTIGFGTAPNDFTATIPAKYMNFGPAQSSDPTTCFGGMQFMSASPGLDAIYGDIFLKAVFTVFEAKTDDKPRLGFAMKPDAGTPSSSSGSTPTSSPTPSPTSTCDATSGGSNADVSVFTKWFNSMKNWITGNKKDSCPAPDGGDDGDGGDGDDGDDGDGDAGDDDAKKNTKNKKGKGVQKSKASKSNKKASKEVKEDDDEDEDEDDKPKTKAKGEKKQKPKKADKDEDEDEDEDEDGDEDEEKVDKKKSPKGAKKPKDDDEED
ncbi:MAG: hypothetical protein LQ340_001389 [Diploschistes diacapsis]|nr:MAG: hypothetical protein LQ340_001389 [Diploschistes diacapsis]